MLMHLENLGVQSEFKTRFGFQIRINNKTRISVWRRMFFGQEFQFRLSRKRASEARSVADSADAFGDTHINAFGDTHATHLGLDTHTSESMGNFGHFWALSLMTSNYSEFLGCVHSPVSSSMFCFLVCSLSFLFLCVGCVGCVFRVSGVSGVCEVLWGGVYGDISEDQRKGPKHGHNFGWGENRTYFVGHPKNGCNLMWFRSDIFKITQERRKAQILGTLREPSSNREFLRVDQRNWHSVEIFVFLHGLMTWLVVPRSVWNDIVSW